MGKSLKSARSLLECLRTTKWDLFSAVAQIQDQRKTDADILIQDVCGWLKADEHALAGGLASKLSEAEGRAIKLLTPPKIVERRPETAGNRTAQAQTRPEASRDRGKSPHEQHRIDF